MNQFLEYARAFNAQENVLEWIETRLAKHLENLVREATTTEEIEHIIDYFIYGNAPIRLQNMSYDEAKIAADKWTKTMQKNGEHIKEMSTDTETVLDFKDGFKIVKLVGKPAYDREGYLMRHCVASYFGNGKEVFSLRDKQNLPHCTIEKDQQIKGKGNGDIHPKYIDYIVRFLEHTGMAVRDSEMAHLGYETVPFGKYAKNTLYRDKYAVKGAEIEYKDSVCFFYKKTELANYFGDKIALFRGDLVIEEKEKFTHKTLSEVSGSVDVREGATFTAPALSKSGSVYVSKGAIFTAPALSKSGSVYVREGATFTAPKLSEVSGSVYVSKGATFTAPALSKSGSVYVREGATFTAPALSKSGSVDVREGAIFTAPALSKSGSVYVREGATFTAPKLSEVIGSVDVSKGATFTAPALSKSGSVYVSKGAIFTAPSLSKSGSVDVSKGATFTAPILGYSGKNKRNV